MSMRWNNRVVSPILSSQCHFSAVSILILKRGKMRARVRVQAQGPRADGSLAKVGMTPLHTALSLWSADRRLSSQTEPKPPGFPFPILAHLPS